MRLDRRARQRSRGFSLIELLIVIAIILILVGIAVPMYDKIQMNARETGAIGDIEAINKAQLNYHLGPSGKYAASLPELCGTAGGSSGAAKAAELSGNICSGESHGYVFTINSTSNDTYSIDARPKTPGSSGRRFFYSDQAMVIRQNEKENEPATAASPQVK